MKKFKNTLSIFVALVFAFFMTNAVGKSNATTYDVTENEEEMTEEAVEEKTVDVWDLFIEAVIWQESRGNENAIGDKGAAVGVLQIHPIMVREANRIIAMKTGKKDTYSYDDRYDREKSIQIFKTVQDFHNKEHSYKRALEIWNKNHPSSYEDNIMRKFNEYLDGQKQA